MKWEKMKGGAHHNFMKFRLTKNLATITDGSITTASSTDRSVIFYFSFAIAIVARLSFTLFPETESEGLSEKSFQDAEGQDERESEDVKYLFHNYLLI
jgi:hypothetical protein